MKNESELKKFEKFQAEVQLASAAAQKKNKSWLELLIQGIQHLKQITITNCDSTATERFYKYIYNTTHGQKKN